MSRARRPATAAQALYLSQIVAVIADFALQSGLPPALLRSVLEQRLAAAGGRASATRRPGRSTDRSLYVVTPQLMKRWHLNLRLLDDQGNPRPLPLRGAAPSVESLIRAEKPRDGVASVLRFLQDAQLIQRRGRGWVPVAVEAIMQELNVTMVEHTLATLQRFLETLHYNLIDDTKASKLIERCAVVEDFRPEAIEDFKRVVREHGAEFLSTMDNWMAARAAQPEPGKGRRGKPKRRGSDVAVHLFAWVQPPGR